MELEGINISIFLSPTPFCGSDFRTLSVLFKTGQRLVAVRAACSRILPEGGEAKGGGRRTGINVSNSRIERRSLRSRALVLRTCVATSRHRFRTTGPVRCSRLRRGDPLVRPAILLFREEKERERDAEMRPCCIALLYLFENRAKLEKKGGEGRERREARTRAEAQTSAVRMQITVPRRSHASIWWSTIIRTILLSTVS